MPPEGDVNPGLLLFFASQIDRVGSSSEGPGWAGDHGPLLLTPQFWGLRLICQSRNIGGGQGEVSQGWVQRWVVWHSRMKFGEIWRL